jgi:hypothetical protein
MATKIKMKGMAEIRTLVASFSSGTVDSMIGPATSPRMNNTTAAIGMPIGTRGRIFAIVSPQLKDS